MIPKPWILGGLHLPLVFKICDKSMVERTLTHRVGLYGPEFSEGEGNKGICMGGSTDTVYSLKVWRGAERGGKDIGLARLCQ